LKATTLPLLYLTQPSPSRQKVKLTHQLSHPLTTWSLILDPP
jgi:hypothetical protein